VAGLVGAGVGEGRADHALLSSLDALARVSALSSGGGATDLALGRSSPSPFLKLQPDPDESFVQVSRSHTKP
jgi:hypothetical protein